MERTKLVTKMCQRHRDDVKNRLVKINETYSASLKKHTLCAPTEHTTLDRSKNMLKNFDSLPKSFIPLSEKTASPSLAKDKSDSLGTHLRFSFKIPKKVKPKPLERPNSSAKNCIVQTPKVSESGTKISKCETRTRQESLNVSPSFSTERKDKSSSLSEQIPSVIETIPESTSDQMQVVEELHLARTEKKLEVDVLQSCGELTCMEIDPPEEEASKEYCKQSSQQDLILVLDTNILLSHLDYVKKIKSQGLGALGSPVVLIPWVVLQELDSLKKGKGLSGSVAHLAIPAISYIYNSLKNREVNLWGQSMQQASESSNCLTAENNDDRVLQCCLQYQSLYPECAVILCTNDKNLCSKAFLSGVKALSKKDLETETWRTSNGLWLLQNIQTPVLPHTDSQSSSSMLSRSFTPAQPPIQERADLSVGLELKYDHQLTSKEAEEVKAEWDLGRCLCELKDNLKEVLSDVLQVEMKAVYEELWLEIVYLKPPWTLQDVLQCLKKHWIAVFGQIVPRKKLQIVLYLIDFFNSGKTADRAATLTALQEARELVKAFANRSSLVPSAIVKIDKMIKSVEPQGEPHLNSCDVVMNDEDEDRQLIQTQVTHQEVWAMFENLWCHVYQLSLEVFKVLGFDSNTMQSLQTAGCSQPPQDAMACLHKLSSMVSQLLQAFSSVLSLDLCLDKVQDLFSIIHSNKIIAVDSRLTATDLLHCFAQHEYREKLGVGGTQLLWLKEALDRCAGAMGQNTTFTTQPEWNNADTSAHQQNRSL
uniref:Transcriptional protein SWT1 n=2 Tax=Cynoglossus semilaevis TaxID=244447 RepID=A0A3P8WKA5_CYNSE